MKHNGDKWASHAPHPGKKKIMEVFVSYVSITPNIIINLRNRLLRMPVTKNTITEKKNVTFSNRVCICNSGRRMTQ